MTSTIVQPRWLLDTNILSRLIKRPHELLGQRLRDLFDQQPGALITSVIVECELMFGAARVDSTVLPGKITALLQFIPVMAVAQNVVPHYANIRAHLQRLGTPIGPNDTLIAAHALALDCTLVTDNEVEFRRVPGLRVENWLNA
ncbi:MAG: hypothetical protein A3E79_13605 [Burkholderiales bacterium RIFCSPHIGHO2_12_FULL_61_11]|nr:MAG: hypothetical protein A3E79_13605 [Burkholderiales bacterium RIFCSPHIGHO2_12_FULL_61_11]